MKACPACNASRTPPARKGWIGVDLDGTLAKYDGWKSDEHIGDPIPLMVDRVKQWLAEGKEVRIVTARVSYSACILNRVTPGYVRQVIGAWCKVHIGQELAVTDSKDLDMIELWDDRAVQVIPNTGQRLSDFCTLPMVNT